MLLIVVVGVSSAWYAKSSAEDYYLAGKSVSPFFVGLSAVATNNSGFMFIGLIGFTYAAGVSSLWLMFGWILGDLVISLALYDKLRSKVDSTGAISFAGVLAGWFGQDRRVVRYLIGVISVLFLLAYASAQLIAGSKAVETILGWDPAITITLTALIVVVYSYVGGIRASIWTDVFQSFIMILTMGTLFIVAVSGLGGIGPAWEQMAAIDGFTSWIPQDLLFGGFGGLLFFIVGWLFAGLSVAGQPHIVGRFMTITNTAQLNVCRLYYYLWYIVFYGLASGVGLLSRIYFPIQDNFDAETALPLLSTMLLPEVMVGAMLAGIFSATMSTADSLVISSSSSLTQDLWFATKERLAIKIATGFSVAIAYTIALTSNESVFALVILSWSGLASAFVPLFVVLALGLRPTQATTVIAIVTGLLTAILWRVMDLHLLIYEGMPGILAGISVFLVSRVLGGKSTASP